MSTRTSETSGPTSGRRHGFLLRLGTVVIAVLLILALIDAGLRWGVARFELLAGPVDIQTPTVLAARLDHIRGLDGYRVVMLGDSLMFGRTMREYGDADWIRHTLPVQFQERLREIRTGPVHAVNLGMEGAVPADMERVLELVLALAPDMVVVNTGLRSFSGDFNDAGTRLTRPWLAGMTYDPDTGRIARIAGAGAGAAERIETALGDIVLNRWTAYRLRDYALWRILEAPPRQAADAMVDRLDAVLKGEPATSATALDEDAVAQLKAKQRYASISVAPGTAQRDALERIVRRLAEAKVPAVVLYGRENPDLLPRVIRRSRHAEMVGELRSLISTAGCGAVWFIGPNDIEIPVERYLDMVHVDAEGYAIYAEALVRMPAPTQLDCP